MKGRSSRNAAMKYFAWSIPYFRTLFTLILLSLFSASIFSQPAEPAQETSPNKFTGDLEESDLRVREFKEQIANQEQLPDSLNLRFRGVYDYVYLVFYDIKGIKIYFRFRDSRWDQKEMKIVEHLVPGQAYRVQGTYLGFMVDQRFIPSEDPDAKEAVKNAASIPVLRYEGSRPLRVDQILF